ncbi:MAG: hypothetical protein L0177_04125 [Chloroflexi bacterium]|nr:hypothetical protein [Chloroflexota bacterium]
MRVFPLAPSDRSLKRVPRADPEGGGTAAIKVGEALIDHANEGHYEKRD